MCSVEMSDLIQTYSLLESDFIQVYVAATNTYGESTLSEYQEVMAKQVQTVPHKPQNSPMRGILTTQIQVNVVIE
jgi:hypothetical protein